VGERRRSRHARRRGQRARRGPSALGLRPDHGDGARQASRPRRHRTAGGRSGGDSVAKRGAHLSTRRLSTLRGGGRQAMIDCNTLIGPYPFRHVPHPEPEVLVRVLAREGLEGAWVGHLPSAFYRDPSEGNAALYRALEAHASALRPVPAIRPDWPRWEHALRAARDAGAPAIRAYPAHWGMGPHDP